MQRALVDGRYEVSRPLGGGGMAEVYLARDRVLERDVAIKILRGQYATDEGFVERFRQEARNAGSLSHPNIVQVYDRGRSEGGEYYIAMEYVPGGTLKDRMIEEGALGPDEAAAVAGQIADALSAAHERGVVHRDIKPQNVLVTRSGSVKVTDFGIARAASSSEMTATSVILGTAAYMSPEQAQGEPATPRSDLYSLGIVLYEMLTGGVPYEAHTPVAVAVKHISQPPRLPGEVNPEVPEYLNDVAAKLLAKRPEDRYASAAEVAEDLRRTRRGEAPFAAGAAAGETGVGREDPTMILTRGGGRQEVPRRRRGRVLPAWALLASVALVALLGAVGWAVTGDRLGDATPTALLQEARHTLSGEVEVPDVLGLPRAEAQGRLVAAGFEVEVRPVESSEEDIGNVLGQSLPGGEEAEEGERISLEVGDGPAAVPAPDLSGLTLDEARGVLDGAGLALGDVDEAASDDVPEGAVMGQDPPTGEELEPDTPVDLTLSSGPEETPSEASDAAPAAPPEAPPAVPAEQQYEPAAYDEAGPPTPAPQQYEPVVPAPEAAVDPTPAPQPLPSDEPAGPAVPEPAMPEPEIPEPAMPDMQDPPFGDGGGGQQD